MKLPYIVKTSIITLVGLFTLGCAKTEKPTILQINPYQVTLSAPTEEFPARHLRDNYPFGSLDEVIVRDKADSVYTIKPGDDVFQQHAYDFQKAYRVLFKQH